MTDTDTERLLAQHLEDIAFENLAEWQHWPKTIESEVYDLVDPDDEFENPEFYRDVILVRRQSDRAIFELDVYMSMSNFEQRS